MSNNLATKVFLVGNKDYSNKAGQFSKIYCCTDYCESPFWELQISE